MHLKIARKSLGHIEEVDAAEYCLRLKCTLRQVFFLFVKKKKIQLDSDYSSSCPVFLFSSLDGESR